MEIDKVKKLIRVGEIVVGDKKYKGKNHVLYDFSLNLVYDDNFPNKLKSKKISLVYLFVVNGKIYKIGQSSSESGISSCLNFYLKSGQDNSGLNRFTINWLIREEIRKGSKVEVYMDYIDCINVELPGLLSNQITEVAISAKGIEQIYMKQYFEIQKNYPKWNFQENNEPIPSDIVYEFGQYISKRSRKKDN